MTDKLRKMGGRETKTGNRRKGKGKGRCEVCELKEERKSKR